MQKPLKNGVAGLLATCLLAIGPVLLQAQDDGLLDVDISINEKEWYENPVYLIGIAVFILVLVLIVRTTRKK